MPDVWRVYRIKKCRHTFPPKPKLVVLVCKDEEYMGFLVNSEISEYISKKPYLLACQIVMSESEYGFLFYKSYFDCARIYPFKDNELVIGLEFVSDKTKAEIKEVVAKAKTITGHQRNLILNS